MSAPEETLVADRLAAAVDAYGSAVHGAARSLVTAGADALTIDVFRKATSSLRDTGDSRSIEAIVRAAFIDVCAAVRPEPPEARRIAALRQLRADGAPAPEWLREALDLEAADEPAPPAAAEATAAWLPGDIEPVRAAADPPVAAAAAWSPPAGAGPTAVVAALDPRPPRRRRHRLGIAVALALVAAAAVAAYLLTREDAGPGKRQAVAPATPAPAHGKSPAELRAERRHARAAAGRQRRNAVAAHKRDTKRSLRVAFERFFRGRAAHRTATTAAPPTSSSPPPVATTAPAPRATSAPPAPTSAPRPAPTQPPPSKDPPGRKPPS